MEKDPKYVTIGEANSRLVELINNAAIQSIHLDEQAKEHWHELVERDIKYRCLALRMNPKTYIQYYHTQIYALED